MYTVLKSHDEPASESSLSYLNLVRFSHPMNWTVFSAYLVNFSVTSQLQLYDCSSLLQSSTLWQVVAWFNSCPFKLDCHSNLSSWKVHTGQEILWAVSQSWTCCHDSCSLQEWPEISQSYHHLFSRTTAASGAFTSLEYVAAQVWRFWKGIVGAEQNKRRVYSGGPQWMSNSPAWSMVCIMGITRPRLFPGLPILLWICESLSQILHDECNCGWSSNI